jgi:eukaryotic-like serine/threonine-protein kinase
LNNDVTRSQPDGLPMTEPLNPQEATLTSDGLPITVPIEQTHGESMAPPGFILDRELGKGGMGVVSLAHQTGLNRPVAIKMLLGSSSNAIIRFLAEAQAIAAVRHPNIVEVYQFGTHNNQPFLAMEYCTGGTLAERLKYQGKFKPRDAAELMALIADGVEAAHAQGIVHRDLKPGNVLIGSNGEPKVCDFGLAKLGSVSDLTETGVIMGTPAYMPPEQARGDSKFMLPAGDVWALGVILYEMVTGQKPFKGDDNWSLLNAITEGRFEQPRSRDGTLPKDLELIILKCLQLEPQDRYATAGRLAADLRNWLEGRAIVASPPGSVELAFKLVKRNRAVSAAFFIATLALLAGTGVSLWQANSARSALRALEKQVALQKYISNYYDAQQAWDEGNASVASIFLSGCHRDLRGWEHDYLWTAINQNLAGLQTSSRPNNSLTVSKDGQYISVGDFEGIVRVFSVSLGHELFRHQCHNGEVLCSVFSPNCNQITTTGADQKLRIWDFRSSTESISVDPKCGLLRCAAYHPSGLEIATGGEDTNLRIWNARTGELQYKLPGHTDQITSLAYHPDKNLLASGSLDKIVIIWDTKHRTKLHQLVGHTVPISSIEFSPDGNQLAIAGVDHTVNLWNVSTGNIDHTILRPDKGLYFLPQFSPIDTYRSRCSIAYSPDSRYLFATGNNSPVDKWDVKSGQQIRDPNGRSPYAMGLAIIQPGDRIVCLGESSKLAVWNLNGSQNPKTLLGHKGSVLAVAFSPDSAHIASGGWDHVLKLWSTQSGDLLSTCIAHRDNITDLAFSKDGSTVYSKSVDGILAWSNLFRSPICEYASLVPEELSGSYITRSWTSTPVGSRSARPCGSSIVEFDIDDSSSNSVIRFNTRQSMVTTGVFSPDGKLFATGSTDHTIKIWDGSFSMSRPEEWEAEEKRRLREWAKPHPSWHAEQAWDSEQKQQWFAAKFHLKKLLELNQFNPTLPIRLAIAEANWAKQAQESPKP